VQQNLQNNLLLLNQLFNYKSWKLELSLKIGSCYKRYFNYDINEESKSYNIRIIRIK